MRILRWAGGALFILIAAATVFGAVLSWNADRARRDDAALAARDADGIESQIQSIFNGEVRMLVIPAAPAFGDSVEFRAVLTRNADPRPIYGVAEALCPDGALERRDAACWRLLAMAIDGEATGLQAVEAQVDSQNVAVAAPEAPVEPASSPVVDEEPTPVADEAAALDPAADAPPASAEPEAEPGAEPEALEAPSALPAQTHIVSGERANLRAGPSTNAESIDLAEQGFPLAFVDSQNGWGRFVALAGAAAGREVWVYLPLTAPSP